MNFFITGAEGFIGSHLVDYLIKNNHKVKAMILYNSFNNLGWLEAYKHKNKKTRRTLTLALVKFW